MKRLDNFVKDITIDEKFKITSDFETYSGKYDIIIKIFEDKSNDHFYVIGKNEEKLSSKQLYSKLRKEFLEYPKFKFKWKTPDVKEFFENKDEYSVIIDDDDLEDFIHLSDPDILCYKILCGARNILIIENTEKLLKSNKY